MGERGRGREKKGKMDKYDGERKRVGERERRVKERKWREKEEKRQREAQPLYSRGIHRTQRTSFLVVIFVQIPRILH